MGAGECLQDVTNEDIVGAVYVMLVELDTYA